MNKKKEGLKNENQLSIFDSSIVEETRNDNEKYITLFPSSWFYNASVIGFLTVMENDYSNDIENKWLQDDGTLIIPKALFETEKVDKENKEDLLKILKTYVNYEIEDVKEDNIEKYKDFALSMKDSDFAYKYIQFGLRFFSLKCEYQNFIQPNNWKDFRFSKYIKMRLDTYGIKDKNKISCGICNEIEAFDESEFTQSKMEIGLSRFQSGHSKFLAPALGGFPNSFWNNNSSMLVCPMCNLLTIFSHIPFSNIKYFINTTSFKTMWYMNKFLKNYTGNLKESLGLTFVELSQKTQMALGSWSLMNIEIINKGFDYINCYSLPIQISKILLNKNISSLLSKIHDKNILNFVISGNFKGILITIEKLIKKDKLTVKEKYLLKVLPELYIKIDMLLKKEIKNEYI